MRKLSIGSFSCLILALTLCLGCKTLGSDQSRAKSNDPELLNRFGFEAISGRKGEYDHIDIWVGKVKDYRAMRVLTSTGVDLYIAKIKRVKNNLEAQTICQKELGDEWRLPSIYDYLSFLINGGPEDLYPDETALHVINKDRVDVPVWLAEENKAKQEELVKTDKFFLIGQGFSEEFISLKKVIADLKKTASDKTTELSKDDRAKVLAMVKDLELGVAALCFAGEVPEDP